jgi:arylsulfatase
MKKLLSFVFLSILVTFFFGCQEGTEVKETTGELDRTVLPIKTPPRQTTTELDVRNVKVPERVEVKAPEGAPNIILVLIDDLGFAGQCNILVRTNSNVQFSLRWLL